MKGCFDGCSCRCDQASTEFDRLIRKESKISLTLNDLTRSNIGWFNDRTVGDHFIEDWGLDLREGVYVLWHKSDYCAIHERFHMTALYAGKGAIGKRLRHHWKLKDFSDELLIYFTFVELPNRAAKYVEQLLLDLYRLPFNRAENPGSKPLCAHLSQCDVD